VQRKRHQRQDLWQGSRLRTLAEKHQSRVTQQPRRLRHAGDVVDTSRLGQAQRARRVLNVTPFNIPPKTGDTVDLPPHTFGDSAGPELLKRYKAHQCEYCGTPEGYCDVHHVSKRSDMQDGKKAWQNIMLASQRKTLVLGVVCHDQLHAGKRPSWQHSPRARESGWPGNWPEPFGGGNTLLPTR
jgi:hypothetical protein